MKPIALSTLLALSPALSADTDYTKRFPPKWLEHNGQIRPETLCYNYPEKSHMYPLCRLQAIEYLQQRCLRYSSMLGKSDTSATRRHYNRLSSKYCTASEQYHKMLLDEGVIEE